MFRYWYKFKKALRICSIHIYYWSNKVYPLSLLQNNRRLSATELAVAKEICDELHRAVIGRPEYIRDHNIDAQFAMPDANWSYDAPNEFVQLFRRVVEGAPVDIDRVRGFTPAFSGYHLFRASHAKGYRSADTQFDDDFDSRLADGLAKRNARFIREYKALTAGLPPDFHCRPPVMLGEVGHIVDGALVNHDTNACQERVSILYKSGLAERIRTRIEAAGEVRICEIGAGYGALCYWFKAVFPNASYTIIDLPESLLFSRLYISLTRPDIPKSFGLSEAKFGVRFVPNYMAEELRDSFDLIINTLSMSEMTEYQVRKYIQLMKTSWLREDGVFFEQNQDNRHMGLLFAQQIFASEFPYHRPLYTKSTWYRNGYPNLWSLKPLD